MSDDAYGKVHDSYRNFKKKLMKERPEMFKKEDSKEGENEYIEEAKALILGIRCEVNIGKARGEVKFVGKVKPLGKGFWVGVLLDEPTGNSNGTIDGEVVFEAGEKYAIFVRPTELKTGDYPEIDEFDEGEDEI